MSFRQTPPHTLRFRSAILIVAVLSLASCAPPEPLRVGFLGGLSGRVADLGIEGRNGAMLAVEERNKAGGVKGRRVELQIEDDQQNPDVARAATAKLLELKVAAIIGPMTSAMAAATVPLMNKAQMVMVSPTVTTNDLTGLDDYFFRVVSPTRQYATKSAQHYFRNTGVRRVAMIYDLRNKSYTESWLEDYRSAFLAEGGEIVASVSFSSGDETRFADLARKLLATKADGIVIIANSVDAAVACQQLRKLNATIPIAASEWAATERLIELGGRSVEGMVIAQFLDRQSTQPTYVEFRKSYLARFGREPGFAGLTAYDATNVVLEGLATTESDQTLKQSLMSRKTFAGAQSPIAFDPFGDTSRETYLTTVRDGAFVALR